jgi:tRNA-modifying protein YgfZ
MTKALQPRPLNAQLPDRGVVSVAGEGAHAFLDNLITNDMDRLLTEPALFAGLLSPQGKILFEFFIVRTEQGYLLDIRRNRAAELVKRLAMYRLRAKVIIVDRSDELTVMATWGEAIDPTAAIAIYVDPRHVKLGRRLIASTKSMPKSMVASTVSDRQDATSADEAAYRWHCVASGIPEGDVDYPFGDTFPHEANYDLLNGVSFSKGCYVGQEVVARMENKTVVRKRIVPITGASLAFGREIQIGEASIGRIGSVDGRHGLAMVRLDRVVDAMDKSLAITVDGQPVTVDPAALARYRQSVVDKPAGPL